MINRKNLTNIAKRGQRIAALRRRRISFPRISSSNKNKGRSASGKFVIYTNDHKRFSVPIAYIGNDIIKHLFEMSEQVFGLPSEGPIKLPCDAVFMEYVVTFIERDSEKDIEKALLLSMELNRCSSDVGFQPELRGQQCPVYAC